VRKKRSALYLSSPEEVEFRGNSRDTSDCQRKEAQTGRQAIAAKRQDSRNSLRPKNLSGGPGIRQTRFLDPDCGIGRISSGALEVCGAGAGGKSGVAERDAVSSA